METLAQPKSAQIYSSIVLKAYDFWVLTFSNNYAWGCSTKKYLLPFFKKLSSQCHLDVGVGTGFYPSIAMQQGDLTLLDSNPNCLRIAASRCNKLNIRSLCHDIFKPLEIKDKFDSISLFYLLHCLPGSIKEKEIIFSNLKSNLSENGVLFGATILGQKAKHNFLGRKFMQIYNQKGIFGNEHDTAEDLQEVLQNHFKDSSMRVIGRVALFSAKSPLLL